MSLKEIKTENVTYYELNNKINIPVNGQIPLQKDQEALEAFLEQNVQPNMVTFKSLQDRLDYMVAENYYEADFLKAYSIDFMERLNQYLIDQDFHFKSFMAAYKFYAQYALKTNDNGFYLEDFKDRVFTNALYFADHQLCSSIITNWWWRRE